MTANEEIWKDIPGYESQYQVSNRGRVKSCARLSNGGRFKPYLLPERILTPQYYRRYWSVLLYDRNHRKKRYMVHRLVAQAFLYLDVDSDLVVNHIDANRNNNCVDNLEVVTQKENIRHAAQHGLEENYGEKNSLAKLTNLQADTIRQQYSQGATQIELAQLYNVSQRTIWNVIHFQHYFR